MSRLKQNAVLLVCLSYGLLTSLLVFQQALPKGKETSKVIRAERFELVDEAGSVHASLGMEKGTTFLTLYSKSKDDKALGLTLLSAGPDGFQMITLANPKERTGVMLSSTSNGSVELNLTGKGGKDYIVRR